MRRHNRRTFPGAASIVAFAHRATAMASSPGDRSGRRFSSKLSEYFFSVPILACGRGVVLKKRLDLRLQVRNTSTDCGRLSLRTHPSEVHQQVPGILLAPAAKGTGGGQCGCLINVLAPLKCAFANETGRSRENGPAARSHTPVVREEVRALVSHVGCYVLRRCSVKCACDASARAALLSTTTGKSSAVGFSPSLCGVSLPHASPEVETSPCFTFVAPFCYGHICLARRKCVDSEQ